MQQLSDVLILANHKEPSQTKLEHPFTDSGIIITITFTINCQMFAGLQIKSHEFFPCLLVLSGCLREYYALKRIILQPIYTMYVCTINMKSSIQKRLKQGIHVVNGHNIGLKSVSQRMDNWKEASGQIKTAEKATKSACGAMVTSGQLRTLTPAHKKCMRWLCSSFARSGYSNIAIHFMYRTIPQSTAQSMLRTTRAPAVALGCSSLSTKNVWVSLEVLCSYSRVAHTYQLLYIYKCTVLQISCLPCFVVMIQIALFFNQLNLNQLLNFT